MQNAQTSVSSTTSALMPAPFTTSQVILTKQEHIQLKQQANQWRAMWKAACDREQKALSKNSELTSKHKAATAALNAQIDELKSELAHMKHLLFGRKSEKTSSSSKTSGNTTRPPSNRKRGHQPGAPGNGRNLHNNLPVVHESVDLPVDEQRCATCHLPFNSFFNDAGCDVIEVEVKAHVRRYHRRHYQKTCQCPETPNITVAPPPPRLINKGKLGISVWVELLLNKYAYGIPINRQLESYKAQGLDLSPATISFGQAAITPFFEPVLKLEHQIEQVATHRDQELKRPKLPVRAKKVLESLKNHWEGLTRFVANPGIPMDNNSAEQAIRTGVLGRKNYYGSGSDWSADIAAFLFSVFMTLKLWSINPKIWLGSYLEACAANGRKPPEDLTPYLPWLMSEEVLCKMRDHDPPKA